MIFSSILDTEALRRAFPGISDRVHAMLWGGFEAAAHPNSLLTWNGAEGCCIGGGLRGLYLAWRASASESEQETHVNLGFSRSTPFAEIVGHEPWAGRIEVRVRSPRQVAIRVPEHVALGQVKALVDEAEVGVAWHGRYAIFQSLGQGQIAAIIYPLRDFSRTYQIAGRDYQGQWRGSTMLEIEPAGERYPIYRRRGIVTGDDLATRPVAPGKIESPTPVLW